MKFVRPLHEYIAAVLRHWIAWLTSSVLLALVGLVANAMPNVQLPLWTWAGILFGGSIVAQYLAWKEKRDRVATLEAQLDRHLKLHLRSAERIDGMNLIYIRIGVENTSKAKSVRGAMLRLVEASPGAISHLPRNFHVMHADADNYIINATEIVPYDLLIMNGEKTYCAFHKPADDATLEDGEWDLQIRAVGHDVASTNAIVSVTIDGGLINNICLREIT